MEKRDLQAFTAYLLEHAKAAAKRQGAHPSLCADDTLGRIIRYCAPWTRKWSKRFFRIFGSLGLLLLPVKVYTLHASAGVSWSEFSGWLNAHEPVFLIKFLGAMAALAFMTTFTWVALATDWERSRHKRLLKRTEAGL